VSISPTTAGNIIQILSGLPDFLRKPMLRRRLSEFYTLDHADRCETIAMALQAAPSIESSKLSILVRTWLEVLAEMDREKRTMMFGIYCEELLKRPSILNGLDIKSLTDTFLSLDPAQREKIVDSLKEAVLAIPKRQKILKLIPQHSLNALGLDLVG
jgi:hypothetical protein